MRSAQGTPAPTRDGPFSSRALVIILAVGLSTFALGLLLAAFSPDVFGQNSAGNDSYSRSLVGHRAFSEWLEQSGLVVVKSRSADLHRFSPTFPLLLLEPEPAVQADLDDALAGRIPPNLVDGDRSADLEKLILRARRSDAPVIVALPKWKVRPALERPGWIEAMQATSIGSLERLLGDIQRAARAPLEHVEWQGDERDPDPLTIIRAPDIDNPRAPLLGLDTAQLHLPSPIQVLKADPRIEPLLQCDQGVLIGALDGQLLLISDPDLLNNRGLAQADHAVILSGLISDHLKAEGLVIDETMHGFSSGESLLGRAMRFPLVLIVIHLVLVMALAAWALGGRFGQALRPPPSLPPGKQLLMDNTARLLLAGGEHADALRRYLRVSLLRMARRFSIGGLRAGAKGDQLGHDLVPRLQTLSDLRGIPIDLNRIMQAAQSPALRPGEALDHARRLHDWRQALTGKRKEDSQWTPSSRS